MLDAKIGRDLLVEHIPYRMRHVDALRWACEILQAHRPDAIDLWIAGYPHRAPIRLFTNPLVETGALAGRVLLGFLGIGLDPKSGMLRSVEPREPDDVTLKDFSLDLLQPADIEGRGREAPEACVRLLRIANEGIANLTFKDPETDDLAKMLLAARLIPTLVCEALYDRLPHPRPKFEFLGFT